MKKNIFEVVALAMLVGLTGCSNSPAEDEKANTEVSQNAETENKDEKAKEETKEDANKEEEKKEEETTADDSKEDAVVKLTTTTSVNDSGLMEYLREPLKEDTGLDMEIVSKGTGAALEDAKAGNADVILVHSKAAEEEFIDEGFGLERKPFMYNYFVIVGPKDDPAGIKGKEAEDAFKAISDSAAKFVSRGDDSGTHKKEKKIWESAGVDLANLETMDNYSSLGDGMGATLTFASENAGYALTDLATFLSMKSDLDLDVLVDESESLKNVYSIIIVNPDKVEGTNPDVAQKFQDWMLGDKAAELISEYGKDEYGQQLFFIGQ